VEEFQANLPLNKVYRFCGLLFLIAMAMALLVPTKIKGSFAKAYSAE
jgi:hypothetical protein